MVLVQQSQAFHTRRTISNWAKIVLHRNACSSYRRQHSEQQQAVTVLL